MSNYTMAQYASAEAPPNHFTIPVAPETLEAATAPTNRFTQMTAHGPFPIYRRDRSWVQIHFSSRPSITPPPITAAATLLYFVRRELIPFAAAPHFRATRREADEAGIVDVGPTREDIQEVNSGRAVRLVDEGDPSELFSQRWDCDWFRSRQCHARQLVGESGNAKRKRKTVERKGQVYQPGTMDGLWQGRIVVRVDHRFFSFVYVAVDTLPF